METLLLPPTEIHVFTDGSTAPGNPGPSGYGFYGNDEHGTVYNGYGPVGISETNNAAELTAILQSLQYFASFSTVKSVKLFSDSQYAINGMWHFLKRGRKIETPDKPIPNFGLWTSIYDTLEQYGKDSRRFECEWVRGHNGLSGNELADRNADNGRLLVAKMEDVHVRLQDAPQSVVPVEIDTVKIDDPKEELTKAKTKKVKIKPLIPLITGNRWFFTTNTCHHDERWGYIYTSSTYKDDKEVRNKYIAKRQPDTHYSIYITKEPLGLFEHIRELFNTEHRSLVKPVEIDLAVATKPSHWGKITESQGACLRVESNLLLLNEETAVGNIVNPPRQSYRLKDIYEYGLTLLGDYLDTDSNLLVHDITEVLFTTTQTKKSSKTTINDSYKVGQASVVLKDTEVAKDTYCDISLTVGVDIPIRNKLSAMLKYSEDPIKVSLLILEVTPLSYRVATVIEHGQDMGIYFTPDANFRLIPKGSKQ